MFLEGCLTPNFSLVLWCKTEHEAFDDAGGGTSAFGSALAIVTGADFKSAGN
jgi:hypothetical protein